jgi:hypothetical protein
MTERTEPLAHVDNGSVEVEWRKETAGCVWELAAGLL